MWAAASGCGQPLLETGNVHCCNGWAMQLQVDPPSLLEGLRWPARTPCTQDGMHYVSGSTTRGSSNHVGGAHCCARAQERILNGAVTRDVRCAAIESACVQITLQACQRGLPPEPSHCEQGQTSGDTPGLTIVENVSHDSWCRLDGVDLQEVFDRRLRVMQGCPHYLRGRFRQATRCALEARHQAVRSQQDFGNACVEVVLLDPLLVVAPAIWWAPRES